MQVTMPLYVFSVYRTLVVAGYEAFVVGGSVRDMLFERIPKDWDITTNATPEQVQALFEDAFYNNTFGTVGVPWNSHVVEVTTYRSEGEYSDFRRPDHVTWGKTIYEDLERRDFTINAIALKVMIEDKRQKTIDKHEVPKLDGEDKDIILSSSEYSLIDPYGGLIDLGKRVVRAVGDPEARFHEDALRMLRAVRFAAQLECTIDPETLEAIRAKAGNIVKISGERIRDELLKILATKHAYEGVKLLDNVGLLQYILPELVAGRGVEQRGHHMYDVLEHSLNALKFCPSEDPIVRLAALLHDIGKPATFEVRDSVNTFYNHDIVGAKFVRQIGSRLRLSKKDREKLYTLVRYHMFTVDTIQTDAAVRRFIRKVGVENIADMVDLRIGDRLGSGTRDAEGWRLREFKKRIEQLLMPTFTVKDLAIDGEDVMRILEIKPGPDVGRILNQLFEEVLDDVEKNTREYLEGRVMELAK